jgi:hypothetical protein
MKRFAVLLFAFLLLAQGSAFAQERTAREAQAGRESLAPRERARQDQKEDARRQRMERRERRFTPQEREKLRQDLLDTNREMHGRRHK